LVSDLPRDRSVPIKARPGSLEPTASTWREHLRRLGPTRRYGWRVVRAPAVGQRAGAV